MRKIVLILFLFSISNLFAKTEVSMTVGKEKFSSKENLESTTSLGVRSDFYLDDLYHLDFGYDNLGSVERKNSNDSISIDRFYGQFSADGEEEYHVVPTLSIGLGYEKQDGLDANSQAFLLFGVGFRYNVSNNFNFVLGTKALLKTDDSGVDYSGNFGVGYLFGIEPVNNSKEEQEEVIIPKKKLDIPPVQVNEQKVDKNCCVSTMFKPQKRQIKVAPPITDIPLEDKGVNEDIPVIDDKEMIVGRESFFKRDRVRSKNYINKGYFIQVGAYTQYKPVKMLNKLARNGYHIILRHMGPMTKVLVGPYESREIAYQKLKKVKKIVPTAFLYKGI